MCFYDNFLQVNNKYQESFNLKFKDLQIALDKKFTVIKTIELDDGTFYDEEIHLLSETFELYAKFK